MILPIHGRAGRDAAVRGMWGALPSACPPEGWREPRRQPSGRENLAAAYFFPGFSRVIATASTYVARS
jgi:hypothetical protein